MTPPSTAPSLVLLVEDDPDTAALYRALLTSEGLEVVQCGDCRQARDWWRACERRPDLLILDMRLPDGTGLELCQEISETLEAADVPPTLLLSAHGDPRLPARSRRAGVQAFLDKLNDLDQFMATVRRLLGRAPAQPADGA